MIISLGNYGNWIDTTVDDLREEFKDAREKEILNWLLLIKTKGLGGELP
tara:strand:- start:682 stop:828 length:147 start_codon:yes stop_codon:yes gene_type:complete